jgi:hypothetical protein
VARLFTLDEASELLPRLRADFHRIRYLRDQAAPAQEALAALEQKGRSNGKDLAEAIREQRQLLEAIGSEVNAILTGITELGIEIKDVGQGLVDFPSDRDGRTVYLCWKLGEERIAYWHEISDGFAGRQPLE